MLDYKGKCRQYRMIGIEIELPDFSTDRPKMASWLAKLEARGLEVHVITRTMWPKDEVDLDDLEAYGDPEKCEEVGFGVGVLSGAILSPEYYGCNERTYFLMSKDIRRPLV